MLNSMFFIHHSQKNMYLISLIAQHKAMVGTKLKKKPQTCISLGSFKIYAEAYNILYEVE